MKVYSTAGYEEKKMEESRSAKKLEDSEKVESAVRCEHIPSKMEF